MTQFVVKRVGQSIAILFFVMFIIYLLMYSLPTSYMETQARSMAQRPGSQKSYEEWLADLNAQYGMDKGPIAGYFTWLKSAAKGEFGESWYWTVNCTEKFATVIWYSFSLGLIAFILQNSISIPLGILAARKQYSGIDYGVTVVSLVGMSLPTFFVATMLKMLFSVKLGWLDLGGIQGRDFMQLSNFGKLLDMGEHYIMPVLTLVIIGIGSMMRYTRANMLEVLNSDYIRTARAKGLDESRVINHHAFRNTLIPLVTILGGSLPGLFSGALITETLFALPGMGFTSYHAMINGDIPFTMFYLMFMSILTLTGNLISDILYAVVDPRVRVQ
ncbi:MAG: ABC transporter permease [Oscillospiraceae bacterium]|nr:ABC transporter permease [Oscillospiraceae bacterium]